MYLTATVFLALLAMASATRHLMGRMMMYKQYLHNAKGKGMYSYYGKGKGKGYYAAPAKGKGYYSAPAKGKGYYSAPAKGYSAPAKGKGYYSAPAKGKGYYPAPAKGYGCGSASGAGSDDSTTEESTASTSNAYDGECASSFPFLGQDTSERLLLREGVIDEIPADLCGQPENSKNVILVIGDGMGWEMIRAGAIAKLVLEELEEMGCDTKTGCPDSDVGDAVMEAFAGRTLDDYYTEGKGHGLSFQDLPGYALVTSTTTVIGEPNAGNHYAPFASMLEGGVADHKRGMAPLRTDENTCALEFDPRDFELEGGNMVLWDDELGGTYPWDSCYYSEDMEGCDIEYIMQHATDSASTAGTLATGHKAAANMLSVTLYEEKVSTLVEDAMYCGKAGGVISSVPIFHATPAAFMIHSNYRSDREALRKGYLEVKPTAAVGVCGGRYYPTEETLEAMRSGYLSSEFSLFEQHEGVAAGDYWTGLEDLDPDHGDKIFGCMGGDYARASESNMPYRGLDSTYSHRYCSTGEPVLDVDDNPIGVNVTTSEELCNHYGAEDVNEIPKMADNVEAVLEFLARDDDGFFFMYEQGDIDWAAHANHMDDMLGTMLDISDSVERIMTWIDANGGYEKNSLYVTADHDHYLTLNDDYPKRLATFLVMGKSHEITPRNNSNVNPWSAAVNGGRHEDDSKSQTEHISDFSTWSEEDIANVGHFWGPRGAGGNGWGSHSTRPVPISYAGDDGCIEALLGTGFQVLGKEVEGFPDKVDQVHLHACMLKNLFGL